MRALATADARTALQPIFGFGAMRQMKLLTTVVVLALGGGLVETAQAEGAWTTDVTVYGWFTGIEGDISAPAFGPWGHRLTRYRSITAANLQPSH
jgi:hypothetical protein